MRWKPTGMRTGLNVYLFMFGFFNWIFYLFKTVVLCASLGGWDWAPLTDFFLSHIWNHPLAYHPDLCSPIMSCYDPFNWHELSMLPNHFQSSTQNSSVLLYNWWTISFCHLSLIYLFMFYIYTLVLYWYLWVL